MADRETLRQALCRVAILSNEKYRGVRVQLSEGSLRIVANNPEQEEAEEEVSVDYQGAPGESALTLATCSMSSTLDGTQYSLTLGDPTAVL